LGEQVGVRCCCFFARLSDHFRGPAEQSAIALSRSKASARSNVSIPRLVRRIEGNRRLDGDFRRAWGRAGRATDVQTRPAGAPVRRADRHPGPAPRCGCRLVFAIPVWGVAPSAAGQMPIPADPKNDRKPGKRPVVFQGCSPCFLSVVWFRRKLSKSLMPLSNCPFGLNRPSLFFLENLPVFEKSGPKPGRVHRR
jgi:hypothetical protein